MAANTRFSVALDEHEHAELAAMAEKHRCLHGLARPTRRHRVPRPLPQ